MLYNPLFSYHTSYTAYYFVFHVASNTVHYFFPWINEVLLLDLPGRLAQCKLFRVPLEARRRDVYKQTHQRVQPGTYSPSELDRATYRATELDDGSTG